MESSKLTMAESNEAMFDVPMLARAGMDDQAKQYLLELQLKMAASSINHEYARVQFDDENDRSRREDLLEYMHDCRCEYYEARSTLAAYDPYALAEFETDLMRQKQATLSCYEA